MGFTVNDRANVVLYTMSGAVAVTAMITIIYTIFSSVLRLRRGTSISRHCCMIHAA